MMKRLISMLLVLALALSLFPVTAGAAGPRQTGSRPYNTIYREYEPNDTRDMADWIDADYAEIRADLGQSTSNDPCDWYYFTITGDQRLYFYAEVSTDGHDTARFKIYSSSGSLIDTADYNGTYPHTPQYPGDPSAYDRYGTEIDLAAGKYYIQVTDPTEPIYYTIEIFFTPLMPAPRLSVANRASDGKIVVSWNAVSGADGYRVERSTSRNGTYSTVAEVGPGTTSYTDTSARAGVTYYYRAMTVSYDFTCLSSLYCSPVARTCDLPRPTGLKISRSAATGKNTITWGAVSGADKYDIYGSTDGGSTYTKLGSVTGNSVTHNSAVLGQRYYYKIRAVDSDNSAATSAYSGYVTGTAICPKPVIGLSNVAASGKTKITWDAVKGARAYQLYISSDGNNWRLGTTTTGTSIVHNSARAGEVWYYKVKAVGSAANSDSVFSGSKYRTCDLARPTLSLSKTGAGKVRLSWNAVPGADKYSVYCSTDGGSTYSLLGTVTGTAVTHTSAEAGRTYRYKIRAVMSGNSSAASAFSNTVSGSAAGTLDAPMLILMPFMGKPHLTWTRVDGAEQYKVYCSTNGGSSWSLLDTVTGTSLSHTDAQRGVTYSYRVRAVSSTAVSPYSATKSITIG